MNRLLLFAAIFGTAVFAQPPLDDPSISYASAPLHDPATELGRKIEQGQTSLTFDPAAGYLPSLLRALDIPVESQMAVFSKTSVQALRIEPRNPRVLFFNDSVIVGWVRGGSIEIASQDPVRGTIFYLLSQNSPAAPGSPLIRHQDCLRCHMTPATLGVPGARVRSVLSSVTGVPLDHAPQYDTDDRTPFGQLWGGWYVTGDSGTGQHRGNRPSAAAHLDSLDGETLPATTLTRYSDIAALLVFEHQMRVMNLLTRANWESRMALEQTHALSAAANQALRALAAGLLFEGESPLPGPIAGTSGFAEVFAARGPRDSHGRSLRDLKLNGKLTRYGCSYMIYSPAFEALPMQAKAVVYQDIWDGLAAEPPEDRAAVIQILRETKPGLPDYFADHRPAARSGAPHRGKTLY